MVFLSLIQVAAYSDGILASEVAYQYYVLFVGYHVTMFLFVLLSPRNPQFIIILVFCKNAFFIFLCIFFSFNSTSTNHCELFPKGVCVCICAIISQIQLGPWCGCGRLPS